MYHTFLTLEHIMCLKMTYLLGNIESKQRNVKTGCFSLKSTTARF